MEMIDIGILGQAVSDDAPCGPNLEYDPAFQELERNLVGKPEVQYGVTVTPAVPPDWKLVRRQAVELLGRTRDLRIAVPLARALLALDGVPGLASGLQAIDGMLEAHWDDLHPQLDADDGNDPTLRINSLAPLADTATVLRELNEASFVALPGLGPLSLRQLDYASGEAAVPAGQTAMAPASIDKALQAMSQEPMQETLRQVLAAATQAHASVMRIEATLVRRVGNAQALNLAPLLRPLARIGATLQPYVQPEAAGPEGGDAAGDTGGTGAIATAPTAVAGISGEVRDRDDVIKTLDKLLDYYQRQEPSSPVPLLLERAKRLVPKTFIEVMEDLAPDGVKQLLVIRGPLQE
ncbi:type VI secretion system protein TssA [Pseudoduganella lutea]|nr:type VI secretion system protein TssA [Pseudoduganella lutea]